MVKSQFSRILGRVRQETMVTSKVLEIMPEIFTELIRSDRD
jgi:hypothetical protein